MVMVRVIVEVFVVVVVVGLGHCDDIGHCVDGWSAWSLCGGGPFARCRGDKSDGCRGGVD